MRQRRWVPALAGMTVLCGSAHAAGFRFPLGDEQVQGSIDTFLTFGAGIRTQDRSPDLIGKANIDPNVCGFPYQGCQGVFKDQAHPARKLTVSQGQFSMNNDDGNLNYDKGDLFQAPAKVSSKLSMGWGNYGLNVRVLYFYDFVNNDFTEFHPNQVNNQNRDQVGRVVPPVEETGYVDIVHAGQRVYGPGGVVRNRRSDPATLEQAGTNLQLLDAYVYGNVPVLDHELTVKLGRQIVSWGESTALVINSLNQANPVNANNYTRVGFQLDELFIPVNMLYFSTQVLENTTVETFYQLEWLPIEAPAPGTYYSTADLGTDYAGNWVNLSFGQAADDPDAAGVPLDNPLTGITPTSARVRRAPDLEPDDLGQYGVALKYFADWLVDGTELGFYFMNYHSRLPYVSFYATKASCARREGNDLGIDAFNSETFLAACPGIPTLQPPGSDARDATDDAVPLSSGFLQLEYPENIQMYGMSFNTTVGDYAFQGEVAYRPNLPLQVAIKDVAFAAAGPTLTRCHDPDVGCQGSNGGLGIDENGNQVQYGPGDFDVNGVNCHTDLTIPCDTFDLAVGNIDGSARSFPTFIRAYRGQPEGEQAPTDFSRRLDHNNPGYVQGFERFDVYQFNLGGTRIFSATENPFAADQIILLFELGATWVPEMPAFDELQIEGPATPLHASAGADGSGFHQDADGNYVPDGSRARACGTGNPTCTYGPDGARFNPHQQDPNDFATEFSWGYRLISFVRYESVLPGISLQPFVLFGQDVDGIAPGPGENFIEGRKQALLQIETRYQDALSFTLGYNWFWGGGSNNLIADRDNAQIFAKYQF